MSGHDNINRRPLFEERGRFGGAVSGLPPSFLRRKLGTASSQYHWGCLCCHPPVLRGRRSDIRQQESNFAIFWPVALSNLSGYLRLAYFNNVGHSSLGAGCCPRLMLQVVPPPPPPDSPPSIPQASLSGIFWCSGFLGEERRR